MCHVRRSTKPLPWPHHFRFSKAVGRDGQSGSMRHSPSSGLSPPPPPPPAQGNKLNPPAHGTAPTLHDSSGGRGDHPPPLRRFAQAKSGTRHWGLPGGPRQVNSTEHSNARFSGTIPGTAVGFRAAACTPPGLASPAPSLGHTHSPSVSHTAGRSTSQRLPGPGAIPMVLGGAWRQLPDLQPCPASPLRRTNRSKSGVKIFKSGVCGRQALRRVLSGQRTEGGLQGFCKLPAACKHTFCGGEEWTIHGQKVDTTEESSSLGQGYVSKRHVQRMSSIKKSLSGASPLSTPQMSSVTDNAAHAGEVA